MTNSGCERSPESCRIQSPKHRGSRNAIDTFDRKIEKRHLEKLVVEGWHPHAAKQLIQQHRAQAVQDAKENPSRLGPWRRRGICEQQMHAEEHGNRNVGVVEKVDSGRCETVSY